MVTDIVYLTLNINARYQAWPYLTSKMAPTLGISMETDSDNCKILPPKFPYRSLGKRLRGSISIMRPFP